MGPLKEEDCQFCIEPFRRQRNRTERGWHLWHDLGEYAGKAVAAHRSCLTRPAGAPQKGSGDPASPGQGTPRANPRDFGMSAAGNGGW